MIIRLDFHSFWHAGSGVGDGPECNALVRRSQNGLPIVPARTLVGLCREACAIAETAGALSAPLQSRDDEWPRTTELFGSWIAPPTTILSDGQTGSDEAPPQSGIARFNTTSGLLDFRSARLGQSEPEQRAWEHWAQRHPRTLQNAFMSIRSTSISSVSGTADAKTLRSIEVSVPMRLHAMVSIRPGCADEAGDWVSDFRSALPLVRAVGLRRARGFGRVSATLIADSATKMATS